MRQQIDIEKAIDRTIAQVDLGWDGLFLVYTDGTFSYVGVRYCGCDSSEIENIEARVGGYMDHTLTKMGIATQEEIDKKTDRDQVP